MKLQTAHVFSSNAKFSQNKTIFAASIRRRGQRKQNFSSNIDNITDNEASLIHLTPARLQGGRRYSISLLVLALFDVYYSKLYCLRLHSIGLHHRLPIHPPASVYISKKSIFVLSFNWISLFLLLSCYTR